MTSKRPHKQLHRYAILPKSSIQLSAESIGLDELSDDVVEVVCQDVNYRLREVVQMSVDRMLRCKRAQLNTTDINDSLHTLGHQVVLGHTDLSDSSLAYNLLPNSNIYVREDRNIDLFELANTTIQPKYITERYKKKAEKIGNVGKVVDDGVVGKEGKVGDAGEVVVKEGVLEGVQEADQLVPINPFSFSRSWLKSEEDFKIIELQATTPNHSTTPNHPITPNPSTTPNHHLHRQLLIQTYSAFLDDDLGVYKHAYTSLHSFQGVNAVLLRLLDCLPKALEQVATTPKRLRLLHLLEAIITNPHVHLTYPSLLQKIVQILLSVVHNHAKTATPSSSSAVEFDEVVCVCIITAKFLKRWSSEENDLEGMVVGGLIESLSSSCPSTLASTILAFNCLGVKVITKHLLLHLVPLIIKVESGKAPTNPPSTHPLNHSPPSDQPLTASDPLSHVLMMTLRLLVAWQVQGLEEGGEGDRLCGRSLQLVSGLYGKLVDMFGDAVVVGLPVWGGKGEERKEKAVKLTDQDSFKTGEELIEEMMRDEVVERREPVKKERSGDDAGMSVTTNFTDAHIKLTIAKKVSKEEVTEAVKSKKHSAKNYSLSDLFDSVPLKLADEALITFKFKGRSLLNTFTEKRKAMLLARNMARQHASVSRYRLLCASLPLIAKRPSRTSL